MIKLSITEKGYYNYKIKSKYFCEITCQVTEEINYISRSWGGEIYSNGVKRKKKEKRVKFRIYKMEDE